MFAQIKQIFNPKNRDLLNKILYTFAALFIFKLGTSIVVPGYDQSGINSLGFLELINIMGGGALEQFSIFALGVMPYITASIIMQLIQMLEVIPYLTELSKQGATGRNKLNSITRCVGIGLAFIQGYMISFTFVPNGDPIQLLQFSLVLTAGTAFLLWLGDQITAKGIGNGISLIIMAGIISTLPSMFVSAYDSIVNGLSSSQFMGILSFILFVVAYIAIVIGIIFEETAERRIQVQYANKTTGTVGGNKSYIPFKLNSAGVVPVIFASALISIPSVIAEFINSEGLATFVTNWINYTSVTGFILYVLLIVGFAYFYAFMQLKPHDIAENLQKNGGFIPGVRPGDATEKHITDIISRLTLVGAIFIAILAGIPVIFGTITGLNSITLGGTGLLIVVGVALETYRQIQSELTTREYAKGRRRRA